MIEIKLTSSMIRNGYIDIPSNMKNLFPSDCFGTRHIYEQGGQVEFRYGLNSAMTGIRLKSENTISPRKRFYAWLQKDLRAQPGDKLRVTKIAERIYQINYLP